MGLSMGQMAYMAAMARLLSNFSFKLHPEVSAPSNSVSKGSFLRLLAGEM